MNIWAFPWLETTLLLPLAGAIATACLRPPTRAARGALAWTIATFASSLAAALSFFAAPAPVASHLPGFATDALAAPMLPVLCLLHGLTLLATSKSRLASGLSVRFMLSLAATLGIVTAQNGWTLVALMTLVAALPVWDLTSRGQRTRGFLVYVIPFIVLLVAGWSSARGPSPAWALGLLLVALKLCGGIVPFHGWLPTLFQRAGFGTAQLFVLPLVEVVAVVRLLLPQAPTWMLHLVSLACLVTALYAACMAVVQDDGRRFFAFLTLSQTSMVMFAVLSHSVASLTAALCLWISMILSLAGLGFSIRALEARFGSLSLREHHGHYEQVPGLAIVFLVAGLASVGFPGTIGFVPMELLISGSASSGLGYSVALALTAMLNGVAILRAYFSLFTGKRPAPSVPFPTTPRERVGIIIISLLVFLAGWFSPSVVDSRHRVAEDLLATRTPSSSDRSPHHGR